MKSHISKFEIPATDISRAVNFYQVILGVNIDKMEIFPNDDQLITGIIVKTEGDKPLANGVTLYLNGGNNLQIIA